MKLQSVTVRFYLELSLTDITQIKLAKKRTKISIDLALGDIKVKQDSTLAPYDSFSQTITSDNGKEFALHEPVAKEWARRLKTRS